MFLRDVAKTPDSAGSLHTEGIRCQVGEVSDFRAFSSDLPLDHMDQLWHPDGIQARDGMRRVRPDCPVQVLKQRRDLRGGLLPGIETIDLDDRRIDAGSIALPNCLRKFSNR